MSDIVHNICNAVTQVVGSSAPLHAPEVSGNEWHYVKECLDTEWVSTAGSYVDRFESELAAFTGAAHCVAVSSGTAALHTCLIVAGVRRDHEVIIPSLTFVATANAVFYQGAVPLFADCEMRTLGIDAEKLDAFLEVNAEITKDGCRNRRTGRIIRALVCMHVFGHPCEVDALKNLCERWRLTLIEDAAESLGSYYDGRHTGKDGLVSALSFNGNKIVTTGGGGAVLTNDPDLARRVKHLTTTAKKPHAWDYDHDAVGFNYRLPNINAAIGCAQLERIAGWLREKRLLAENYRAALRAVPHVESFQEPKRCRSNYWLNVMLLDSDDMDLRNDILKVLNEAGLMSRPIWIPMHMLEMYRDCPRDDLSVTEKIHRRLISLPSSPRLARADAK